MEIYHSIYKQKETKLMNTCFRLRPGLVNLSSSYLLEVAVFIEPSLRVSISPRDIDIYLIILYKYILFFIKSQ